MIRQLPVPTRAGRDRHPVVPPAQSVRREAIRSLFGFGLGWPIGISPLLGLALARRATAQPLTAMQAEVDQLLAAMGPSGCSFFRNGRWYSAEAAQAHLRSKYNFLVSAGQITTADQFIDKAATQSSFSGQPYRVRCSDGKELPSRDWLREQLKTIRAAR